MPPPCSSAPRCLLVLEIVAGRLVAPYVGVSLYTWTSIIGVILAGLSLGNWLGGVWADRGGNAIAASAGAGRRRHLLPAEPGAADLLGEAIQQRADAADRELRFAPVLFFVPAALIGVVTPLLTTLALRLDPRAGHVVGRMHALAAIGSIAGTFAAGYWLVQTLGTRSIVLGTGLRCWRWRCPSCAAAARRAAGRAGGGAGRRHAHGHAPWTDHQLRPTRAPTSASASSTRPELAPFGEARGLVLDHLLHGINHRDAPEMLIAPYVHGIDELAYAQFGADTTGGCAGSSPAAAPTASRGRCRR
jgi:MFS family permease